MRRAVLACWVAIALLPFAATRAHAENKRPSAEAVKAAQNHMARAQQLYETGDYDHAIAELETARALDPYAKELVFNLGIVHEKAGHIDKALHFYHLYLEMDLEPAERSRAEGIVHRLEGARAHVTPTATAAPTVIVQVPPSTARGRIDALTISSAVLAVAGFGVGAGFGIAALGARPPSPYVTGAAGDPGTNGTYADLKGMVDNANQLAVIADISFLVGLAFTGVTLGVFFGRTKHAEHPHVTIAPTGRGVVLGGTF